MTSHQEAERQLALGRKPLPLDSKQKTPRDSGWPEREYTAADFTNGYNIGLKLGDISGGLVDVDIDCREARELADDFLPPTGMEHGRNSTPRSHRWYLVDVPSPPTRKYTDEPKDGESKSPTLVELRANRSDGATGEQTVIPPSVTPRGDGVLEAIRWDKDGQPAKVDKAELCRDVARLAGAALLARRWMTMTGGHEGALGLVAALLRAGWEEDYTSEFIQLVARVGGDPEWAKRGAELVPTTAKKLIAGDKVTGIPTFIESFGRKQGKKVLEWLGVSEALQAKTSTGAMAALDAHYIRSQNAGAVSAHLVNAKREVILQAGEHGMLEVIDKALLAAGEVSTPRKRREVLEDWYVRGRALEEQPAPFCFPGDDRLTFWRFDWEPEQGAHPSWDEFTCRLTDPEGFMAFIWSCYEERNRSRQFIWLHGDGQDGKSVVLRVLAKSFGKAAGAIGNASLREPRFLLAALYGKRIVTYADSKNARFTMSEQLRNITAGDHVSVERKGKDPFDAFMYVKLLIGSNHEPEITSQDSDVSRLIYLKVKPSKRRDDLTWEPKLVKELPAFLWSCREEYCRRCPEHGDIALSQEAKDAVAEAHKDFEERFLSDFEAMFVAYPPGELKAHEVREALERRRYTTFDIKDWKVWVKRTHAVVVERTNAGIVYKGLRFRGTAV